MVHACEHFFVGILCCECMVPVQRQSLRRFGYVSKQILRKVVRAVDWEHIWCDCHAFQCTWYPSYARHGKNGIRPHLTPTIRKRKSKGMFTNSALQGRCKVCENNEKSKYVCPACRGSHGAEYWLCHSDTGRDCWIHHFNCVHNRDKYI